MILNEAKNTVERNMALTGQVVTRYTLDNPQILDSLPESFEIAILPNDDPEMQAYNLALHDQYRSADKPVVFVRLGSKQNGSGQEPSLDLYVPLAV